MRELSFTRSFYKIFKINAMPLATWRFRKNRSIGKVYWTTITLKLMQQIVWIRFCFLFHEVRLWWKYYGQHSPIFFIVIKFKKSISLHQRSARTYGLVLYHYKSFIINFILQKVSSFNPFKMVKHTLKILRCSHCKIFKLCLTILQHYAWKG